VEDCLQTESREVKGNKYLHSYFRRDEAHEINGTHKLSSVSVRVRFSEGRCSVGDYVLESSYQCAYADEKPPVPCQIIEL